MKKGLVIVLTGDGKGKTTSALGMALRACGYGMKTFMAQFIKGSMSTGELEGVKRLQPDFDIIQTGKGFVGIEDDNFSREEHTRAAKEALNLAWEKIASGKYNVIILDEINQALKLNLIEVEDVLGLIKDKPSELHLILTGRDAHPSIIEIADLVTEMKKIKHPYDKGIPAQKGIDF